MPSAAEPTHPGPEDHPPGPQSLHTNVVHLPRRTGLGRGRRRPVPPAPSAPAPDQAATPQQQLAETVEAAFLRQGRTLTDPPTAEAYTITLGLVRLMLEGSQATGVVDGDQHTTLAEMVQGMVDAPKEL